MEILTLLCGLAAVLLLMYYIYILLTGDHAS